VCRLKGGGPGEREGKVKVVTLISAVRFVSKRFRNNETNRKRLLYSFGKITETVSVSVCFGSNRKKKYVSQDTLQWTLTVNSGQFEVNNRQLAVNN
jgi:intracellular sulfur oxidation DsrE/DsrF family protein